MAKHTKKARKKARKGAVSAATIHNCAVTLGRRGGLKTKRLKHGIFKKGGRKKKRRGLFG